MIFPAICPPGPNLPLAARDLEHRCPRRLFFQQNPVPALLPSSEHWGPFSPGISHAERVARLRTLRMAVQNYTGIYYSTGEPLMAALLYAEFGEQEDLEAAVAELDRLPSRARRHVLSAYGAHSEYKPKNSTRARPQQLEGAG
jgi:hypothetical protein